MFTLRFFYRTDVGTHLESLQEEVLAVRVPWTRKERFRDAPRLLKSMFYSWNSGYTNVSNFHGAGRGAGYLYSMLMHSIIHSSCLAGYVKLRLSSVVGVAGIVVIRVLVPGGLRRFVPKINKKKKKSEPPH
ncbi:uncharacterized protein H6S33_011504 [Morchella sextelata]|uniref:uncharacterized protein n=1 Tax=Morchella sextelata TaxID=1174677 RepID=UPI001D03D4DB|nr:uncharacterized protein H6S33_011504 [Morchella sextelata]KAH0611077.1 hypothetical protein H6S33_011504 [Morchella sextelata]